MDKEKTIRLSMDDIEDLIGMIEDSPTDVFEQPVEDEKGDKKDIS